MIDNVSIAYRGSSYHPVFTRVGGLEGLSDFYPELSAPGVDITHGGESIPGTVQGPMNGSDQQNYLSAVAFCNRQCQFELNGLIKGGMGTLVTTNGGASFVRQGLPVNTTDPPSTVSGDVYEGLSGTPDGLGARELGLAADTTRYIGMNFNASAVNTSGQDKEQVKKLCVLYRQYPGGPMIYVDHGVSTWPNRDSGSVKLQIDSDGVLQYAKRSALMTTASSTAVNRFAIRGGLSSNPTNPATTFAYVDGVIAFNEDEGAGIRNHRVNHPGANLTHWTEGSLQATIDSYCARSSDPATNCRLVTWSVGINDANSFPGRTPAEALTHYEAVMNRAFGLGAMFLFQLPLIPASSGFYDPAILAQYRAIRAGIYDLQAKYSDQCGIMDMAALNNSANTDAASWQHGFYAVDLVHQSYHAHAMVGILMGQFISKCLRA
jgi:hypothetical protein